MMEREAEASSRGVISSGRGGEGAFIDNFGLDDWDVDFAAACRGAVKYPTSA